MHLSTVKIPFNFGFDWHCPSISFFISKPILYQPEKMLFASFLLYILEWDYRFQVAPICCLCGVTCKLRASLRVVSLKYQYFDTVFWPSKCDRTITICVNAYRKWNVWTVLTNMWHQIQQLISDSTTENPEYRPEAYGPNSTTTLADLLKLLCACLLPVQVSAKPDTQRVLIFQQ